MPPPDLTEQDYIDLAALVREAIEAEPYRAGPRIKSSGALDRYGAVLYGVTVCVIGDDPYIARTISSDYSTCLIVRVTDALALS